MKDEGEATNEGTCLGRSKEEYEVAVARRLLWADAVRAAEALDSIATTYAHKAGLDGTEQRALEEVKGYAGALAVPLRMLALSLDRAEGK